MLHYQYINVGIWKEMSPTVFIFLEKKDLNFCFSFI